MSAPGAPGAAVVVSRYLRRRTEEARAILIEELRRASIGYTEAVPEDDAIPIVLRYLRAAREGAARLTLRMLAKLVAGQMKRGTMSAPAFLRYADSLVPLTREEIIVVGSMCRAWTTHCSTKDGNDMAVLAPWLTTKRDLAAKGWSEDYLVATATAGQRIGLLVRVNAVGSLAFRVSPLAIELGRAVDFEDALRREPAA